MLSYFSRFQQPILRFLIRSQDKSWKLWPELFHQGIGNWQDSTHQPEFQPFWFCYMAPPTLSTQVWYLGTAQLKGWVISAQHPMPPINSTPSWLWNHSPLLSAQFLDWACGCSTPMRCILSFIHSLAYLFNTYYKPGTVLGAGDNKQNIKTPALMEFRHQNFGGSYWE